VTLDPELTQTFETKAVILRNEVTKNLGFDFSDLIRLCPLLMKVRDSLYKGADLKPRLSILLTLKSKRNINKYPQIGHINTHSRCNVAFIKQLRFKEGDMKRSLFFLISTSLILLFNYGSAFSQTSDTYTGCLNLKGKGRISEVAIGTAPKSSCKKTQAEISWNEIGPIGPQGIQGIEGPQGDQGPVGPAGKDAPLHTGALPIEVNEIQELTVAGATGGTFDLTLGAQVTNNLSFDISAEDLRAAIQAMAVIEFSLSLSDLDVKVTQVGSVFRIAFVGEMSDKTTAEKTLTVDGANLLPSPGASADVVFADEREIALAPGFADGQLLEWDAVGNNWVAMPPRSITIDLPPQNIVQPTLTLNYAIATVGLFPSRSGEGDFIGEIILVGFNFAPRGYALCNGQLLQIAQNTALFSLLGTMYGGDGRTTFGLPDLRGTVPVGFGTGPGLTPRTQGSRFGAETVNPAPITR
jgi:microcystin-dependent protein